jgi:hypothetical protein
MSGSFFFLEDDGTTATPPAVYFASKPVDHRHPPPVHIDLPKMFLPGLVGFSQGPFSFNPSHFLTPDRITVDNTAGGAWDFSNCTATSPPFRLALATAYVAFLAQLEPLLLPAGSGTAASFALLRQLVAGAMPLTPAESLFYRYSFMSSGVDLAQSSNAAAWVDLVPGMRLRIEGESYQGIDPSTANPLNGFVPSGTTYAEVGTSAAAAGRLGLNPFLTQAVGSVTPDAILSATSAVGGVADVTGQFQLPYWRLCYPALPLTSAGSQGWAGTQQNATLLGAPDRATLEQQTQAYAANGVVTSYAAAYFNGRVMVTPEISIFVAGQRAWVPLGTSLRNVLETLAPVPYFGAVDLDVEPKPEVLSRALPPSSRWAGPAWAPVQLAKSGDGYQYYAAYGTDSLDLPLVAGDVVTLALPS